MSMRPVESEENDIISIITKHCPCLKKLLPRKRKKIDDLPPEVMGQIFRNFPPYQQRTVFSFVSKYWYSCVNQATIFMRCTFFEEMKFWPSHEIALESTRKFRKYRISIDPRDQDLLPTLRSMLEFNGRALRLIDLKFSGDLLYDKSYLISLLASLEYASEVMICCSFEIRYSNPKEPLVDMIRLEAKHVWLVLNYFDEIYDMLYFSNLQTLSINCQMHFPELKRAIRFLNRNCRKVKRVNLQYDDFFKFQFQWTPCELIISNFIWHHSILYDVEEFLRRRLEFIETLRFNQANLPKVILKMILERAKNLKVLECDFFFNRTDLDLKPFENIVQLSLLYFTATDKNLDTLARLFPNLERFYILVSHEMTPEFECKIRRQLKNVKSFLHTAYDD